MFQEIEVRNGRASFAFTGSRRAIWHKNGKQVTGDLTPAQMQKAAGVDWDVETFPLSYVREGQTIVTTDQALVRSDDGYHLDTISKDWKPVQNSEAFEFFNDFVEFGDLEMETAGSLNNGKKVWAMARVKEGVEIVAGDEIRPYLLFTNPHTYGARLDVRMVFERVISGSAHVMSMRQGGHAFKMNHRTEFNPTKAKTALKILPQKLEEYAQAARFLANTMAKEEDVVDFLKRVFVNTGNDKDELSLGGRRTLELMETQPGAELSRGTWWNAVCGVSHYIDDQKGRSESTRMESALYGAGMNQKNVAMKVATEYAKNPPSKKKTAN